MRCLGPRRAARDCATGCERHATRSRAPCAAARADESAAGKTLTLYITKEAGMEWWASVAEGEPAIDVTKVCVRAPGPSPLVGALVG